jgi:hypothetical protein
MNRFLFGNAADTVGFSVCAGRRKGVFGRNLNPWDHEVSAVSEIPKRRET